MKPFDRELGAWRANPEAQATIALASRLAGTVYEEAIREVGGSALTWHAEDLEVMLVVGRMYLNAGMLSEAQAALLAAGKATNTDYRPFFWLGLVLLRRGDAERSHRLLARALELGADEHVARPWYERALRYVELQRDAGPEVVAAAVAPSPVIEVAPPPPPLPAAKRPLSQRRPVSHQPAAAAPEPVIRAAAPVEAQRANELQPTDESDRLLEQLALSGVYEPKDDGPEVWQLARQRSQRSFALVFAIITLVVAGIATYAYAQFVKGRRAAASSELVQSARAALSGASPEQIHRSSHQLQELFDLDSSDPRAALLWLQNRALTAHWLKQPAAIAEAVQRAKRAGAADRVVAFGNVAALLDAGDVAGSVSLLRRWDASAEKDALYQLYAGMALERLGDLRALPRYQRAVDLDARAFVPKALLGRLVLIEHGPDLGRPLVAAMMQTWPDRPESRLLTGLLWAVDAKRGRDPPQEAELEPRELEVLPASFKVVAAIVEATRELQVGDRKHAARSIRRGVAIADTPIALTELGHLAIRAGDAGLARDIATRVNPFNGVYRRGGRLAVRVALHVGDLQWAQQAADSVSPDAVEAILVSGIVAYEQSDFATLRQALGLLTETWSHQSRALDLVQRVASGKAQPERRELTELVRPEVVWGELIAIDLALDMGELELCERWMESWTESLLAPPYRLRLARLARYQKRFGQALAASEAALADGPATSPAVVERALSLLDAQKLDEVEPLIEQHGPLIEPFVPWLYALVDAARGDRSKARARLRSASPPPQNAPLMLRAIAVRALVAAEDMRGKIFSDLLMKNAPTHPELVFTVPG